MRHVRQPAGVPGELQQGVLEAAAGAEEGRLGDLADARWIDAPDTGLPLPALRAAHGGPGFRPALRYDGTDVRALTALAAAGHGLTLLPRSAAAGVPGAAAVPLTAPHLVHRVELVHSGTPTGAAAALARVLSARG
ncbi:LysR substrate-binding domain-containing protein [Streptomyces sp. NPDC003247]|uniref:LysR substrate-binding domain-containing protein n=1 Tax=Streptomyces sp. NPDC003247 TaxID=3364677 RepID=UPI0036C9D545